MSLEWIQTSYHWQDWSVEKTPAPALPVKPDRLKSKAESKGVAFGRKVEWIAMAPIRGVQAIARSALTLIARLFIYVGSFKFGMWVAGYGSKALDKSRECLFERFKKEPVEIEEVNLERDGEITNGIFVKPRQEPNGKVVILTGGNAHFYEEKDGDITSLLSQGYAVFTFNLAGYGKSTGTPGTERCIRDEELALQYVVNHQNYAMNDVVRYAYSISTGPAMNLAAMYDISELVIDGAYSDLPRVAQDVSPLVSSFLGALAKTRFVEGVLREHFDYHCTKALVKSKADNIVIIRRERDEMMTLPFDHGQANFEAYQRGRPDAKREHHVWDVLADHCYHIPKIDAMKLIQENRNRLLAKVA